LFGSEADLAHERDFAERCHGDRHHFRFIVSPDDAADMTNLKAFTRELLIDMEHGLGTKLDWVAVEHYNRRRQGSRHRPRLHQRRNSRARRTGRPWGSDQGLSTRSAPHSNVRSGQTAGLGSMPLLRREADRSSNPWAYDWKTATIGTHGPNHERRPPSVSHLRRCSSDPSGARGAQRHHEDHAQSAGRTGH
jgi:hypothetical protein